MKGFILLAHEILNLKLNYAMNENLYISAVGENLTDQLYRTYSSGIPAMGRRVRWVCEQVSIMN